MLFKKNIYHQDKLRLAIDEAYRRDETTCVKHLLKHAELSSTTSNEISRVARSLITEIREAKSGKSGIDAFMLEYDLSSEEGIAIMCLAESLLRIPDKETIDKLIRDKLTAADWHAHLGQSSSFTVNATTWGLMLTGKMLTFDQENQSLNNTLRRIISRSSEAMIRKAIGHAMKVMSRTFVMGRTIEEALSRARNYEKKGYRYSYDMLGEAALTAPDAERYFNAYQEAINQIGQAKDAATIIESPSISVKLSALHPRYEYQQREKMLDELIPRVFTLAHQAKQVGIGLTIDAEEAHRLDLSLDVIEAVFLDPSLESWQGFGLALQSYQKRAFAVLDWLVELTQKRNCKMPLRLIKGAYWDTEIKMSQILGLDGYPVFTRKVNTDVSFVACAKKILKHSDVFYPQFATHNAYSVATILSLAENNKDFEFQCLHGMGQQLYEHMVTKEGYPCRIYAPVGSHEDLLPYLVRRLLENGANTSFVNRLVDAKAPMDVLLSDPLETVAALRDIPHPKIPLPNNIFGHTRKNSEGIDFSNLLVCQQLELELSEQPKKHWSVAPIIDGHEHIQEGKPLFAPHDQNFQAGLVKEADQNDIERALKIGNAAYESWDQVPVETRAKMLEHAADLLEKHRTELLYLLITEAGKTLNDAVSEIREAADFCRYYAFQARKTLDIEILTGYTGEYDHLEYHGRGLLFCISPWNFPLAIFTGQIVAALVAGNTVIAKPAEITPLVAGFAVRLLHAAGIPGNVLQLLPGKGSVLGSKIVADKRIKGVIFTGSTDTAEIINKTLAARGGEIVPFIAETGGQNAMIVDSSALPEQVVKDVMTSAFNSAGQRCSALRVLYLQSEIAPRIIEMLKGAMAECVVGDPRFLSTDVGPVIDNGSKKRLESHLDFLNNHAELIYQVIVPDSCQSGFYVAPSAYKIPSIKLLPGEVFGPILHVIIYDKSNLDNIIEEINSTGFGLTFGIQSRINETIHYIQSRIKVGNCYVNRNMIGAVVGVQPFGGEGLSGTGPKAGGPNYLKRLCIERTLCVDTTAAGGNASLVSLEE